MSNKDLEIPPAVNIHLFEYDTRFEALYGANYHYYDYHNPVSFNEALAGFFDVILIDPPYVVGHLSVDYSNFSIEYRNYW